jgi:hypothetical protein
MENNMEIIKIIQTFVIAINISISLYSQETPIGENTEQNNYEQREQAFKDYIQQELAKGKNLREIYIQKGGLWSQCDNTIERKAYQKIMTEDGEKLWKEVNDNNCYITTDSNAYYFVDRDGYFVDTPFCKSMEERYTKIKEEYKNLSKISQNTPEIQIMRKIVRFLDKSQSLKNDERIKELLKEQQKIEKTIKDLLEEKQSINETIVPKLHQEKQELLYSLSLY